MKVQRNLERFRRKLNDTCRAVGRPLSEITLVAVSKTRSVAEIRAAMAAGQAVFGENYAQELVEKAGELTHTDSSAAAAVRWHFIGSLQRNKVRHVLPWCSCIHTIDSTALMAEIQKRARAPVQGLIQINIGAEKSKQGILPEEAEELIRQAAGFPHVQLTGLMCIPPFDPDPEKSRPFFRQLRELRDTLNARRAYPHPLTELSMGMTHDFGVAIEEGATLLRIGEGIFGKRPSQ